jgi:hypothetical protein
MQEDQLIESIGDPAEVPFAAVGPGWYVLIAFTIIILLSAALLYFRYRQRNKYRREALSYLKSIESDPSSLYLANELMKRICLRFSDRTNASLRDNAWIEFLNSRCKSAIFSIDDAKKIAKIYTSNEPQSDPEFLIKTNRWIHQHGF